MREGLSRKEIAVWTVCLLVAVALITVGSVYLAGSMLTADVSQTHKPGGQKTGSPAISP